MKTIFLTLFFIIFFSSCIKDSEIIKTDIQVELSDDVSPVMAKFYINQRVPFSKWKINDKEVIGNSQYPENYELKYCFENGGIYNVNVNADVYNSEDKIIGNAQFTIPDFANKLKISGINLNNHNFNFTDSEIRLEFYYFNGINLEYYERIIPSIGISNEISLNNNLILNILDVKQSDQNHYLHLNILGLESGNEYFKGRIWLYTNYHSERLYEGPNIGRICGWNNEGDLLLELDWYKE